MFTLFSVLTLFFLIINVCTTFQGILCNCFCNKNKNKMKIYGGNQSHEHHCLRIKNISIIYLVVWKKAIQLKLKQMYTLCSSSKWSKYYININTFNIYYTVDKKRLWVFFKHLFYNSVLAVQLENLMTPDSYSESTLTRSTSSLTSRLKFDQIENFHGAFTGFFFCRHSFPIAIGLGSLFNRKQRAVRSGFMEQLQTISDKDPLRQQKDMFRLAS